MTCYLVSFFVAINLILSLPVIAFSENRGVQKELQNFAKNFQRNDLIIMTPGWDWQKWAYPLHYLYSLNILPNLNLYPERKFIVEIKDYVKKLDNDATILYLKKDFEKKSFQEFKDIVKNSNNVYLLVEKEDLIIYPYRQDNLVFISDFKIRYKFLSSDSTLNSTITKYIQKNNKKLNLNELNAKISQIPPQKKQTKELSLRLYRVKNKNALIFLERQYTEEDIIDFRKTLKKWLK